MSLDLRPSGYFIGIVLVVSQQFVLGDHEQLDTVKRAWACYGNSHNFLDISCPPDRQVELLSMMNGAKPTNRNCPFMTTLEDNFRQECCTFSEGDCVIGTHRNSFPVECFHRHFCQPQSRLADTGPTCNSNHFPKFTHYTEIVYRCVLPPGHHAHTPPTTISTRKPTTTPTTSPPSTATTTTTHPNNVAAVWPLITTSTPTTPTPTHVNLTTFLRPSLHRTHPLREQDADDVGDDFLPAMVGGMIAGIIGLMVTIFLFMFYWGRKKQVRISGKPQTNTTSSVWDFLLVNTMSVRAFRGYDNFSSTIDSRVSISSDETSALSTHPPVVRAAPAQWLPNISVDSGQGGESNLTSDDNCSVVTLGRGSALYTSSRRGRRSRSSEIQEERGEAASDVVVVVNRL